MSSNQKDNTSLNLWVNQVFLYDKTVIVSILYRLIKEDVRCKYYLNFSGQMLDAYTCNIYLKQPLNGGIEPAEHS